MERSPIGKRREEERDGTSEQETRTKAGAQRDDVRFLSLRIVDYDELPARLETRAQILDASVGWMPLDFRRMEEARRIGFPAAPYFGVYAVENDEILSTVRVMRIPYTLANGSVETVSGIQGVITRREWSRRGLARKLLAEVHRREAEAGLGFVMLWTGHSLMAHNLYNSMGYQDIYTPNLAIRKCDGRRARPRGYELKTARRSDSELIEKLHSDSTAGRVGFTPRPKGIVSILFKLWLKPDSFRLILRGGKPIGYAQLQKGRGWVKAE
ncbi:MAG: GNAT family N-acetyltransferase, partial [Thaumarchaeota archaeon]|nr:GNAT family N-acetyltransferase [Nitrososphaerota archaeon]